MSNGARISEKGQLTVEGEELAKECGWWRKEFQEVCQRWQDEIDTVNASFQRLLQVSTRQSTAGFIF